MLATDQQAFNHEDLEACIANAVLVRAHKWNDIPFLRQLYQYKFEELRSVLGLLPSEPTRLLG